MSTLAAPTTTAHLPDAIHAALRRARAALYLGAAAAIALAAIGALVTTSTGDGKFRHTGDYLLTGDGIPYMLALLILLPALRTLQERREGRIGRVGLALASIAALVLVAMFVRGLVAGSGSSLGPTYVIAVLATIAGVALFAAGSWRAGLLPRWLLAAWTIAWALGIIPVVPAPAPLLLAAAYLTIAALLPRRAAALGAAAPR